ncbi:MAG: DUF1844 domain-containing protein [bacterium]|nr:DUF1844 domain-containing protein [bacterium]
MSAEDRSSRRIKVVDRRWFTEDGNPREDRPAPQPAAKPEPQPISGAPTAGTPARDEGPSNAAPRAAEPPPAAAPQPEPDSASSQLFLELVATLAQQAELLLVGAPGLPKQPDQAQRLIDYLTILESKTRGNLSAEEAQVLSGVLFQLRTEYVQAPKG